MIGTIDIIIIFILLLFMVVSYNTGFFAEIFTLLSLFLSGYLAYILSPFLSRYLTFITISATMLRIISGIIIFIVCYLVLKLIRDSIFDFINEHKFYELDRFLGIILGLFKGLIFIGAVIFIINRANSPELNKIFNNSIISKIILNRINSIFNNI